MVRNIHCASSSSGLRNSKNCVRKRNRPERWVAPRRESMAGSDRRSCANTTDLDCQEPPMKLHFEENLPHQLAAIEAVCDLFRGQEVCRTEFTVTQRSAS